MGIRPLRAVGSNEQEVGLEASGLEAALEGRRNKMGPGRLGELEMGRRGERRLGDGVMRFQIMLLTIHSKHVKYDYHILQGD